MPKKLEKKLTREEIEEKVSKWKLLVEDRNKIESITCRIREPDKRAVWITLVNTMSFGILTEKDIYLILKR